MGEKPTEADEAAAKANAGGGGRSEIAIGDPGVNDNLGGAGGSGDAALKSGGSGRDVSGDAQRAVAGGLTDPTPAESANLNLSKSNIDRAAGDLDRDGPADDERKSASMSAIQNMKREGDRPAGPEPAAATNLNSSKSNIERTGPAGGEPPEPAEATNLNSSRSNIYRTGGPSGDEPSSADEGGSPDTERLAGRGREGTAREEGRPAEGTTPPPAGRDDPPGEGRPR
jgi:hypothetical protein